jgi:hypothetical protein
MLRTALMNRTTSDARIDIDGRIVPLSDELNDFTHVLS